jgi:hypothetical protein
VSSLSTFCSSRVLCCWPLDFGVRFQRIDRYTQADHANGGKPYSRASKFSSPNSSRTIFSCFSHHQARRSCHHHEHSTFIFEPSTTPACSSAVCKRCYWL